jgi:hypothetical protein
MVRPPTSSIIIEWFRCELRGGHTGRVEVHADHSKPFKGHQHPGEVIILCVRWCLRYPLSYEHVAGLVANMVSRWMPVHLALVAGVCTGVKQTLPAAFKADQQELSDRRDVYKGERRRPYAPLFSAYSFARATEYVVDRIRAEEYTTQTFIINVIGDISDV